MKNKTLNICCAATIAASCTVFANVVTTTKPGHGDVSGVNVPSGTAQTVTDDVLVGEGAEFRKIGEGTLTLPMSKINRSVGWNLAVEEGKAILQPGDDATVATAPAVMTSKAAVWFSADAGLTLDSEDGVSRWCDARETDAASPTRIYADPAWTSEGTAANSLPVKMTKDNRTAVYFGGKDSGKYMKFSSAVTDIYHLFVVHGVYDCFGAVVGSSTWGYGMLPGWTSPGYVSASSSWYYGPRTEMTPPNGSARHSLDGKKFDPYTTTVKTGFQLLESEFVHFREQANLIMRSHYSSEWSFGGDYVSEIVLFTNKLSSGEVLDVERYLMRKYSLPHTVTDPGYTQIPDAGIVKIGDDAEVEVSVAAGETSASAAYVGGGVVKKTGAGTMVVGPNEGKHPEATLDLQAGTVHSIGGSAPPVKLQSGDNYESNRYFPSRTREKEALAGSTLKRTRNAGNGVAKKTGDDWLKVNGTDDDVSRIRVENGVLQLVGKASAPDMSCGVIDATVVNGDFEMAFTTNAAYGLCSLDTTGLNGWRLGSSSYVSPAFISAANPSAITWFGAGRYIPPSWSSALLFRANCLARSQVTVQKKARYVLEFCAANRYADGSSSWQNAELLYVNLLSGSTTVFSSGDVIASGVDYARLRYDLGELAPGEYTLSITANPNIGDCACTIDDVRVFARAAAADNTVMKIPNGDFETYSRNSDTPRHYMGFGTVNKVDGWTFTCSKAGYDDVLTNNLIGVVGLHTRSAQDSSLPLYDYTSDGFGNRALMMLGDEVQATTSFEVPAGRYRLAAAVARKAIYYDGKRFCDGVNGAATLTLADESELSFGLVGSDATYLHDAIFPNIIEVPTKQTVTLTIKLGSSSGAMLFDDLRLVSVGADCNGNYLKNGNAESKTDWKNISRQGYGSSPGTAVWGYQSYEGKTCFSIGGTGVMYQDVEFESAGIYRFTTHVRSRPNHPNFGDNLIRIWCYDTSENVTNQIDDLMVPYSGGFVERSYVFEITKPGKYRFGFSAHGETSDRTTFMDGLSIRKVSGTLASAPSLPESVALTVAEGARLVLDYTGTLKVKKLTLGGQRVPAGKITAADYPDYLGGVGSVEVEAWDGITIIVR